MQPSLAVRLVRCRQANALGQEPPKEGTQRRLPWSGNCLCQLSQEQAAVSAPDAAMHAGQRARFLQCKACECGRCVGSVRKVVHLPSKCFTGTEDIRLRQGLLTVARLGEEVATE